MSELFRPDAPRTDDLLRRRAAFVAAVLSRVIVHDVDGGFAVELEGPLVPPDAPVDPVNPATAMEPPGPHELSTNGLVRGQFAQVPSWRSPQVGFTVPPGSQQGGRGVRATATFETAKEAILFVHEHLPDGPLSLTMGRMPRPFGSGRSIRPSITCCASCGGTAPRRLRCCATRSATRLSRVGALRRPRPSPTS